MLKEIKFTDRAADGFTQEWVFHVEHGRRMRENSKSGAVWLDRLVQQGETYRASLEAVPEKYKEALEAMGYEVQQR